MTMGYGEHSQFNICVFIEFQQDKIKRTGQKNILKLPNLILKTTYIYTKKTMKVQDSKTCDI